MKTLKSIMLKTVLSFTVLPLLLSSCYNHQWVSKTSEMAPPPQHIKEIFDAKGGGQIKLNAISPSDTYQYDAWEKDQVYATDNSEMHFNKVSLTLKDKMPQGMIIVHMVAEDATGNQIHIDDFDLMRLVPSLNTDSDHLYPELLLEEFNRYGVKFRKEFDEFKIITSPNASPSAKKALQRTFRASVTNGCLDAGKWEFNLNTEDYKDFNSRIKNPINFNQSKILAHSWFKLDPALYEALLKMKNPGIELNGFKITNFDYEKLSQKSNEVVIDFDKLRSPLKKTWPTTMVEVGHQSRRSIIPLDMEEHYKIEYGLFIGQNLRTLHKEDYNGILKPERQPLQFAQFRDEGFYSPKTPLSFDLTWLKYMDSISISSVDIKDTECLTEIKISGKWCPFTMTIGNVDLAQINEQKLYGLHFGFNVYPKGRRYNPAQPTISFDEDLMPQEYKRYVLLTDTKTGKWVDNFHKGLGKVYLTYPTLEKDVLDIYLISYERIAPLWMGRVKLPKELRERVRIRKQMYSY